MSEPPAPGVGVPPGGDPATATPDEGPPPDAGDHQRVLAATRAALAPLHFLVGRWEGRGESLGEPVHAHMSAALELSGCFLLTREQTLDSAGHTTHEDLAIYRLVGSEQTLKVQHMQAPGVVQEYHVETRDPADPTAGVRWNAGPFSPRVVLRPDGPDALVTEVWMAWRSKPDTVMRWTRRPEDAS